MLGDARQPGVGTPDGAEGFHAPARVNPASRILSEMFATATSQGDRMNSADTTRMAEAFVEGIFELMARTLYDKADQLREDKEHFGNPSGYEITLNKADAMEVAAAAIENLLPPERRIDRREDV